MPDEGDPKGPVPTLSRGTRAGERGQESALSGGSEEKVLAGADGRDLQSHVLVLPAGLHQILRGFPFGSDLDQSLGAISSAGVLSEVGAGSTLSFSNAEHGLILSAASSRGSREKNETTALRLSPLSGLKQ